MTRLGPLVWLACATQPTYPQGPPPALAWSCPLGSALGAVALEPEVAPGRYDATYSYDQDKLPTMERTSRVHVDGQSWLELKPTGEAAGCIGSVVIRSGSVSKYASADGEHHTHTESAPRLLGVHGRWEQLADGARVTIDQVSRTGCEGPFGPMDAQLVCGGLSGATPMVACRPMGASFDLSDIGLNLEAGPRAGPAVSASVPMGREERPASTCGPWWVLGTGLKITSTDGRHEVSPTVVLSVGGAAMEEGRYRTP